MTITVKSVRRVELSEPAPVYDATSPRFHNFALANGVVVHNTAVRAKSPNQEILALRGKMANVITRTGSVSNSEVVGGILRVVGFDPNAPDRPLRVGKLILLADADEDGSHITVLLMTIVQRIMPRLLTEGRVFLVDAPLFEAMAGGEMVAGNNLAEMERRHGRLTHTNRMKGWGSCDPPLLRRVAFDPDTRKLLRPSPPDRAEARGLSELMGADSGARKALLAPPGTRERR